MTRLQCVKDRISLWEKLIMPEVSAEETEIKNTNSDTKDWILNGRQSLEKPVKNTGQVVRKQGVCLYLLGFRRY